MCVEIGTVPRMFLELNNVFQTQCAHSNLATAEFAAFAKAMMTLNG